MSAGAMRRYGGTAFGAHDIPLVGDGLGNRGSPGCQAHPLHICEQVSKDR